MLEESIQNVHLTLKGIFDPQMVKVLFLMVSMESDAVAETTLLFQVWSEDQQYQQDLEL